LVEKSPLQQAFLSKLEQDMEKLQPKETDPLLRSDSTNPLIQKFGITKEDVAKMWFDNNIFKNLDLDMAAELKDDSKDDGYNSDSDGEKDDKDKYEIPAAKKPRNQIVLSNSGALASDVRAEILQHQASKPTEKESTTTENKEEGEATTKDGDDESEDEEDLEQKVEALAIGTMLIRKKGRRELEDKMFNRYTYSDDHLPTWFEDDEKKHAQQALPLTKDAVQAIRMRWKEINSRPIKKVAEARARKKLKTAKKLAKAKQRAMDIVKDDNLSAGQKIAAAQKTLKKAGDKKKDKVYMVTKHSQRGSSAKTKTKFSKGARVKVVDSRMKKDIRAAKNRAKTVNRGNKKVNGRMKAKAKTKITSKRNPMEKKMKKQEKHRKTQKK